MDVEVILRLFRTARLIDDAQIEWADIVCAEAVPQLWEQKWANFMDYQDRAEMKPLFLGREKSILRPYFINVDAVQVFGA